MIDRSWNVDTLKEYVDQRFIDEEKAVRAALAAAEKAVERTEANSEKWRANANEWRAAMIDRENKFAMKDQQDSELRGLRTELHAVQATLTKIQSEAAGGRNVKDEGKDIVRLAFIALAGLVGVGILAIAIINMLSK